MRSNPVEALSMLMSLPFLLIYFALSALLVRTDIRTGLLPDKFLCPLLWTGLLYQLVHGLPNGQVLLDADVVGRDQAADFAVVIGIDKQDG